MAENKTKVMEASVGSCFSAIEGDARRKDREALATLMTKRRDRSRRCGGRASSGSAAITTRTRADVDLEVLERLVVGSVAERKRPIG